MAKKISIDDVLNRLQTADSAELIRVATVVRMLCRKKDAEEAHAYEVGDKVKFFNSKKEKMMKGIVIKIKKRKVLVKTEDDGDWNVPGTLICKSK